MEKPQSGPNVLQIGQKSKGKPEKGKYIAILLHVIQLHCKCTCIALHYTAMHCGDRGRHEL